MYLLELMTLTQNYKFVNWHLEQIEQLIIYVVLGIDERDPKL